MTIPINSCVTDAEFSQKEKNESPKASPITKIAVANIPSSQPTQTGYRIFIRENRQSELLEEAVSSGLVTPVDPSLLVDTPSFGSSEGSPLDINNLPANKSSPKQVIVVSRRACSNSSAKASPVGKNNSPKQAFVAPRLARATVTMFGDQKFDREEEVMPHVVDPGKLEPLAMDWDAFNRVDGVSTYHTPKGDTINASPRNAPSSTESAGKTEATSLAGSPIFQNGVEDFPKSEEKEKQVCGFCVIQ